MEERPETPKAATSKTTLILDGTQPEAVDEAARILRSGGLVVFPTETVYGLGANALDPEAVASIFRAKGRPADNPLIAHLSRLEDWSLVASQLPEAASFLFGRFSPGPLTILLPRRPDLPEAVTAGLPRVALRIPSHPLARALIAAAGVPVVAPSANRSGRPSPTSYAMACAEMDGRADAILDGGDCEHGLESTVVSVEASRLRILRPGAISAEMLRDALDSGGPELAALAVEEAAQHAERPASPGMKYAHYRPKAEIRLCASPEPEALAARYPDRRLGFIISGSGSSGGRLVMGPGGSRVLLVADAGEYARLLYRAFHLMDESGVELIFAQEAEERGIGRALMNRLRRAASGRESC